MLNAAICVLLFTCTPPAHEGRTHEIEALATNLNSTDPAKVRQARNQLGEIAALDPADRVTIWRKCHINSLGMQFVKIPAGEFTMGPDFHRLFEPHPAHPVRITMPYYICVTETTNRQYQQITQQAKLDHEFSNDDDSPVVNRNFDEVLTFCSNLSRIEGAKYRLPTEAEWEYACRAGSKDKYYFGMNPELLPHYAWFKQSSGALLVGQLQPNRWGLYDMHGNVEEFVSDWYSSTYYSECKANGVIENPQGPPTGANHILRGGNWFIHDPLGLESSFRRPMPFVSVNLSGKKTPSVQQLVGFRLVRTAYDGEASPSSADSGPPNK